MVNKIYALIGPFASGRRTLAMQLSRIGVHYIPTYTTKPTDAKDTHPGMFRTLPQEEFDKQDFMLRTSYQGYAYGLTKTDVLQALKNYHASIIILDMGSIAPLSRLLRENLVTIYLMVDYVTLVGRMLTMGCSNDDIKYQLEYAESNKLFDAWKETTYVIKNTHDLHVALEQILALMGLMHLLPSEELNTKLH
ncbi:MAG: guanylate kinase [Selenomonas sp.]|uniref:guanylate kinase n=1 Tax=Selenomonas sp. TaxID=2053611 RepID=UPI0025EAE28C|nr:guanylate kinase [Selenomonas sp.]MCI6101349.1 guanylate kinase [Selenomonas sp.]MCI6232870.1 guanylate kinase [Selenomonas sp.]